MNEKVTRDSWITWNWNFPPQNWISRRAEVTQHIVVMSVTSSTLEPIFPSLRPRPKCNVPLKRCHAVTFGVGRNDWQRVEGPQLIELSATAHLHIGCIGEFLSPELGSDVTERNASHLFHSLRWGRNRIIHADPANINYRRNRIGMRYEPKPLSWFISIFYVTFNRFNSSPKVLICGI